VAWRGGREGEKPRAMARTREGRCEELKRSGGRVTEEQMGKLLNKETVY